MKAKDFLKVVRADMQELYDLHQLSISTNGKMGLRCLNIDEFMAKMQQTDKEILKHYFTMGAQIDDAEEFLSAE